MGKGQTLDRLRVEEVCTETFLSGPQEARGRLLPFSCMQEKQLIIRVSTEKEGSWGRRSLMFSRSNSYDHDEGAMLFLGRNRSVVCAACRTYIRVSLYL